MKSLRGRISLRLLLSLGCLLLIVAGATCWMINRWLEDDLDAALLMQARMLAALTQHSAEGSLDLADARLPALEPGADREYFQLWSGDGRLIERSVSLTSGDRLNGSPSLAANADETAGEGEHDLPREVVPSATPRFRDVMLPDGRSGRLVQVDFMPESAEAQGEAAGASVDPTTVPQGQRHRLAVLVVAKDRQALKRRQGIVFAAAAGIVVLLLAMTAWVLRNSLRRGLQPLEQITERMGTLGARNLTRLQISEPSAELQPVIDQLNALLERLEQAFDRERRLSSNIAHELRTPIAELRNLAEVGARWPDKRQMVEQFFADVEGISKQMEKTVTHLLALARYESGLEIVRNQDVAILPIVEQAWRPQAKEAARKGITMACEVDAATRQRTDPDKLELMLTNLLGNAVAYSPDNSTVRCFITERGGSTTLVVANPAEHLQPEDLPLIFDRFWRKDPSRTGAKHSGLGLSLVRAFGQLLRIEIQAVLDANGWLHIELVFDRGQPQPTVAQVSALRLEAEPAEFQRRKILPAR